VVFGGWAWRWPAARVGIVLFVLALLPSANLLPQFNFLADRFLYLPLVGLGLAVVPLLAALQHQLVSSRWRFAVAAVLLTLAGLWAARSWTYQRAWNNERALWDFTLEVNPSSRNALLGAGVVRFESGDVSGAGPYWSEMLRRSPADGLTLLLAAMLEQEIGRHDDADRLFAGALRAEPTLGDPDRFARYYGWRPRMRAALDSLLERAKITNP
jgi:protein O-mannosyl-transferase